MIIKKLRFVVFPDYEDKFIAWEHTYLMTGRRAVNIDGFIQTVVVAEMTMTPEIFDSLRKVLSKPPFIYVVRVSEPDHRGRDGVLVASHRITDYKELIDFVVTNTDLEISEVK